MRKLVYGVGAEIGKSHRLFANLIYISSPNVVIIEQEITHRSSRQSISEELFKI